MKTEMQIMTLLNRAWVYGMAVTSQMLFARTGKKIWTAQTFQKVGTLK